ncbi:MAG: hypothetical protein L0227_05905 [Chloroflexi bacterium]|nr:hypothetical protein [Chloroflexota bacterium]
MNLRFVGGPEFYQVVFEANKPREGTFCTLEGHDRRLSLALEPPFLGSRIHDLSVDEIRFVRPPRGLWEPTLPAGWELQRAEDVVESPSGRWLRIYATDAAAAADRRRHLELYQAFQHDVGVTGGDEITSVEVNGTSATLYRYAPEGELVLTWMAGGDGFALVAYEDLFPIEALITLAETMKPPTVP